MNSYRRQNVFQTRMKVSAFLPPVFARFVTRSCSSFSPGSIPPTRRN